MANKCPVDDRVSFTSNISHGHVPSTGKKNKSSPQDKKEPEVSTISSEGVQSTQQTSSRSDLSSESGHPINKDPIDPDASRTEVSQLKTLSCSSKESGVVVQLNSVDSSDPDEKNPAEKKPCTIEQEVSGHSRQDPSPPRAKAETTADSSMSNKHQYCGFDLNEDTEEGNNNGASEPIPVVAKVGVPIGLPRKPLQFGGELGWRRSTTPSAFRPTISRPSSRGKNGVSEERKSLASQGIDLNIAALEDENFMGATANANAKQGIDLNFNPVIEDTTTTTTTTTTKHIRQISETRELLPKIQIPAGAQDAKRPPPCSYLVDMSSMPGFNHPQTRPFLVAGPTAEQVRMVVPIHQSEIPFLQHAPPSAGVHSISPGFYPHTAILPHGPSVIAAYPGGALHVIDGPQVLFPAAYATSIRPGGAQNGTNVGFLVPAGMTRNALFEERAGLNNPPSSNAKRREPDGGWDYSQVNYRPMASWNQ